MTYKVKIRIGLGKKVLNLTKCLIGSGEGPNAITMDYSKPQWKFFINSLKSIKLRTANIDANNLEGIIALIVQMGDLQV